ncbi:hypothetical protein C8N46_10761 [Kordia periserrulae]|uniref:Uncharacterized protein n=1 Tax=Kordia periserrulae TaxID=701523 RepID=A0A2T6BVE6_9FLAO|nr:hypothetical protein [Kordia periserrulae]PTX60055.1 hypothetical protein C8N46_10761 [Kordia periserrulae]
MKSHFKKKIILFCGLILVTFVGFAQTARQAVQASMFHNDVNSQAILQKNLNRILKANIDGTPYFDESFNSAKILPIDKVFFVRYNAAIDEMEVIQNNDTLLMNKENRKYVIKQNKGNITYKVLENPEASNDEKLGYYIQLTDGENVKLYRKDRKKFVESKAAAYGSINETRAKYKEQKSEFYIEYGDSGTVVELPRNKKSIIKLFADKGDIKNFIKKNNIKTNKEADAIQLVNYVNSL